MGKLASVEENPVMPDQEELREELFKFFRKFQHQANKNEVLSFYKTAEEEKAGADAFVQPVWPRTTSLL